MAAISACAAGIVASLDEQPIQVAEIDRPAIATRPEVMVISVLDLDLPARQAPEQRGEPGPVDDEVVESSSVAGSSGHLELLVPASSRYTPHGVVSQMRPLSGSYARNSRYSPA